MQPNDLDKFINEAPTIFASSSLLFQVFKRFLTILLFLQLFQEAISIDRLEFLEYYLLNILTGDLKRQQRFTSLERTTQGL